MAKWTGKLVCGICGHTFGAEAEIDDGRIEPVIPAACESCGHAAAMPDNKMGTTQEGDDDCFV